MHSDTGMADTKLKYDELLLANRILKEEIESLRSKNGDREDNLNHYDEVQISREKAFLEHLIDSIPEAIAIIDNDGKIVIINKEFTDLFGYTAQEATNRLIDDLMLACIR